MALDTLCDPAQLSADLASVANAIRTKGGTSAQLAFPAGFVSAIGDIQTGVTPTGTKTITLTTNGTTTVDVTTYANATISVNVNGSIAWPTPTVTFVAGSGTIPGCFNNAKFIPQYDNELIIYVFQPGSYAPTVGSATCYLFGFHRVDGTYGTTNRCWVVCGGSKTTPWSTTPLIWSVRNASGVSDDADGYITFPTSVWYYCNANMTVKAYEIPLSSMGASAT